MIPVVLLEVLASLAALAFASAACAKIAPGSGWMILSVRIAGRGARGWLLHRLLPPLEFAVAVVVLVAPALGFAAVSALLAAMAAGALMLTGRMEGEECGCFGGVSSSRIGPRLAMRNAVLSAAAAAAAVMSRRAAVETPRPIVIIGTAAAVGSCLLIVRLIHARRRPGPPPGSTPRVPRAHPLRAAVFAFVSGDCAACRRTIPALAAMAVDPRIEVRVAVAPGPSHDATMEALGDAADASLWDALRSRWRVPGTPFAVVLDGSGRVTWAGIGQPEALVQAVEKATRHEAAPALSRRAALRSAGAFALSVVVAPTALAAGARRRPRRRTARANALAGVEYRPDRRNQYHGSCRGIRKATARGVFDATGSLQQGAMGYTWAEGFETGDDCAPPPKSDRLPLAHVINHRRATRTWRGQCNCPQRLQTYTDEARCNVECPSGLACFGFQCETTFEEWCVDVLYSIKIGKRPKIVISQFEWFPPAGATARCQGFARLLNDMIRRHEEQHARDIGSDITDFEQEHDQIPLRKCAPTEAAANAAIASAIEQKKDAAYARLVAINCARNAQFHLSSAGQTPDLPCEVCD